MTKLENSEKHPVDALFAAGLAGHELEPSAAADMLFAKALNDRHQTKEKKRIFPFWTAISIAASIALAIGFYWSFTNNLDGQTAQNQVKAPSEAVGESNEQPFVSETPSSNMAVLEEKKSVSIASSSSTKPTSSQKEVRKAKSEAAQVKDIAPQETIAYTPVVSATGVSEIDELIPDKLTLALQKAEKKANKVEAPQKTNNEVFQKDIGETIIIVSSNLEPKNEIYLPEVNEDSPISLAQAEELGNAKSQSEFSLIAKVFTEIKHLKHGEKVDLPNFTASNDADERGFLAQETYELKERISWVKNRIAGR